MAGFLFIGGFGPSSKRLDVSKLTRGQVPIVDAEEKSLIGSGIQEIDTGQLLHPSAIGAESASIDFGDTITVTEATGFLSIRNHPFDAQFIIVDVLNRNDAATDHATVMRLTGPEEVFMAQPDDSGLIDVSPHTFMFTNNILAQTNTINIKADTQLENLRVAITDTRNNVIIKYLPSKIAWLSGEDGITAPAGDFTLDLGDTQMRFDGGVDFSIELRFDAGGFKADATNTVPFLSFLAQRAIIEQLPYFSDLFDEVASMLARGVHKGAEFEFDETNKSISLCIPLASPPLPQQPALGDFSIDIDRLVAIDTDLNISTDVFFTPTNAADIDAMTLEVIEGDDIIMVPPTTNPPQSQAAVLAGIDTSAPGEITFRLRGLTVSGTIIRSAMQRITIEAPSQVTLYWGVFDSDNVGAADLYSMRAINITALSSIVNMKTNLGNGQFLIVLSPDSRAITSITEENFQIDVISTFDFTMTDRTIDTVDYSSYVLENTGASGGVSFEVLV